MNEMIIKRGDTFSFSIGLTDEEGIALTGVATRLKCQIRSYEDLLVDTLVIAESALPGTYTFKTTKLLPLGSFIFDVQYTDANGAISSSDTVTVNVVKDVTANG